jgi:hypothetical protein
VSYQEQFEQEEWENIARTDPMRFVGGSAAGLDARDSNLATEKQVSYLEGLRDGKDLSSLKPEQIAWLRDADFTAIPKKRASDVIGQLKDLPWMPRDAANLPTVKDGRYAIPKEDGTLMFYSVKQGRSVTFVDVWASDARWPVKDSAERWRILTAINGDPDAGPRFGREIGRCYVCGRTLTDETSRALGIGPVCRGDQ